MVRKMVCAVFVMAVGIGFVLADEVACRIEKLDGNTATCQQYTQAKKGAKAEKKGESYTVTIGKDCVIAKGTFNKDTKKFDKGDAVEGGVKALAEMVSKAGDKGGVSVQMTTDKEGGKGTASQILVTGKGGKKAE